MNPATFDPLPVSETKGFEKFAHHIAVDDRVIVRHIHTKAIYHGKVTNVADGRVHVLLDGGGAHYIQCFPSEVEPELFPAGQRPLPPGKPALPSEIEAPVSKSYDPMPISNDIPPRRTKTPSLGESLARAIESGAISEADRVAVENEISKIQRGQYISDPFGHDGETNDPKFARLEQIAKKYQDATGTEDSGTFAKRARPGLKVGQRIRDAHTGRIGVIKEISGHMLKLVMDGGELHCLVNASMENLVPVEG